MGERNKKFTNKEDFYRGAEGILPCIEGRKVVY